MDDVYVLDKQNSSGPLWGGNRANCALGGAARTLMAINKAIPIVHSAPGCSGQIMSGSFRPAARDSGGGVCNLTLIPTTGTLEREVVFGGEKRLREQIQSTVELLDGEIYMVFTGCTAGLIGDDNMSVINGFRAKGIPIGLTECSGFLGSSYLGYNLVVSAIIDQFLEQSPSTEKGFVNLLGIIPGQNITWRGDLAEIKRMLERIGLKVNTLLGEAAGGFAAWKNAPKAELNIVFSGWVGIEPAQRFEKKLGVPYYVYPGIPMGLGDSSDFLRQVGERLGIDKNLVEKVIAEEENICLSYLQKVPEMIHWQHMQYHPFILLADSARALGLNRFMVNELSFRPVLVVITDNPPSAMKKDIEEKLIKGVEYGAPPKVVFEESTHLIEKYVLETPARIILGTSADRALAIRKQCYFLSVSFPAINRAILGRGYAGYNGGVEFCEDFFSAVYNQGGQ